MPVRRTHSKTRYGCTQCKGRKLKCDQAKPKCKNCEKRSLECSFESSEGTSMIFIEGFKPRSKSPNARAQRQSPAASVGSSSNTASSSLGSPSEARARKGSYEDSYQINAGPGYDSGSMYEPAWSPLSPDTNGLLDLFRTSTWKTLGGNGTEAYLSSLWLNHVYGLAQHNSFIHHGILAVTAMHLALVEPSPEAASSHQALAQHHHSVAIQHSQPYMRSLQPQMVPSLYVFSILMNTYAFGYPKVAASGLQPVQDISRILNLLRGTSTIAQSGDASFHNGPFAGLREPHLQNQDAALPLATESALNTLSAQNEEYTRNERQRASYRDAIGTLWFTFLLLQERPGFQMAALPFATMIPAEVLSNIQVEEPMALLILAHYGVALGYLGNSVWQSDWGRWIVDDVTSKLGPEWLHCMHWARAEVGSTQHLPSMHYG